MQFHPHGDFLAGRDRGQRVFSGAGGDLSLRRNQRGLKRKIERKIKCDPGLRFFLLKRASRS